MDEKWVYRLYVHGAITDAGFVTKSSNTFSDFISCADTLLLSIVISVLFKTTSFKVFSDLGICMIVLYHVEIYYSLHNVWIQSCYQSVGYPKSSGLSGVLLGFLQYCYLIV